MKYIIIILAGILLVGCTTTQLTCEQQGYIKPTQCASCKAPTTITQTPIGNDTFVYFIDVGQGDAQLIKQGNTEMLIDCGKNTAGTAVVQFLKNKGITQLEYLMITHPDSDHLGGCDDVLKEYAPTVITNGDTAETVSYNEVEAQIIAKSLQKLTGNPGDSWQIGASTLKIIQGDNGFTDNENSIVAKLIYKNVSVLFTGDCEKSCETLLWNKDIASTVLKVGHHGSKFATSLEFLGRVSPKIAIISVGSDNSYGHPAQETLDRLSQENVVTYRTDMRGTISFKTDGMVYEVI